MKPKLVEKHASRILRLKGYSINEISRKLHTSKSSVSYWVRNVPLRAKQVHRLRERERLGGLKGRRTNLEKWQQYRAIHPKPIKKVTPLRYVESFFDTWSPNMAYILGYFAADGCMYINRRGSHYIAFTSTDLELITKTKEILKLSNLIETRAEKGNCKTAYTLQIGSKKVYQRFLRVGFTPKKSLTLTFPNVPNNLLNHFVRGYFDGDGCASFNKIMRKDKIYIKLMMRFTCGNKTFLHDIQKRLKFTLGISGSLHPHTSCYDLAYSTHDVLKLHRFLYQKTNQPYLKRKWKILQRGIKEMGP